MMAAAVRASLRASLRRAALWSLLIVLFLAAAYVGAWLVQLDELGR